MTIFWTRCLIGALLLTGCGAPPADTPAQFELKPAYRYIETYPHETVTLDVHVRGGDPRDPVTFFAKGLPVGVTMHRHPGQLSFVSGSVAPGAYKFILVGTNRASVREVPLQLLIPSTGNTVQEGGRPVTTTVNLDLKNTESLTISPAGAQVQVVSSDGAHYTVTLPAGAVHEPTTLRLTPVTSAGWPGFTSALGVQIKPDTLQLWKPARVDVTIPARTGGAGVLRAFGTEPQGASLFLKEVTVQEFKASFTMTHAGVGGIGWVNPDALNEVPVPRLPEDHRYERLARYNTPEEVQVTELTYDASLVSRFIGAGAWSGAGARKISELLREVTLWTADLRQRSWEASFAGNTALRWALLADVVGAHAARYGTSCGQWTMEKRTWREELSSWRRAATFVPEWSDALGEEGIRSLDHALTACH